MMNRTEFNSTTTPSEMKPPKGRRYITKVYMNKIQPDSAATDTATTTETKPVKRRRFRTTVFDEFGQPIAFQISDNEETSCAHLEEETRLVSSNSSGSTTTAITPSVEQTAIPPPLVKKRRILPTATASSKAQNSLESSRSDNTDSGITLSPEQKAIHDMVVEGKKNIFFTGAAGTGKSVLLKTIIRSLYAKYPSNTVAITAPTGIAAIHIGGVTINRFAGVGKGDDSTESYIKRIRINKDKLSMWLETNVLIIDEVSMVSGLFLDMLETIARTIRHNKKPFGGIQTIFTGDFYQLPPVNSRTLAFEAKCWRRLIDESRFLTVPFRQKDMRFATMLNELRLGKLSPETKRQFEQLKRKPKVTIDIEPTELYAMRKQVQTANDKRLESLKGPEHSFQSTDTGDLTLLNKCMAERTLKLRVGAQVMLIKNLATDLVNGSIGIVTGFTNPNESKKIYPIVQFANGIKRVMFEEMWDYTATGRVIASRKQVPLILAWAMSIHKSQGMTIEYVKVDLKGIFEAGQAYTALSRATTLENLQVLNFQERAIKIEPRVLAFYRSFLEN